MRFTQAARFHVHDWFDIALDAPPATEDQGIIVAVPWHIADGRLLEFGLKVNRYAVKICAEVVLPECLLFLQAIRDVGPQTLLAFNWRSFHGLVEGGAGHVGFNRRFNRLTGRYGHLWLPCTPEIVVDEDGIFRETSDVIEGASFAKTDISCCPSYASVDFAELLDPKRAGDEE